MNKPQLYQHMPSGITFKRGWMADSKEWRWRCECGDGTGPDEQPWHLSKEEQYRDALRHDFMQHWPLTWQVRSDPQNPKRPLYWLAGELEHLMKLP